MGEEVKLKPMAWPPSKALLIAFTPLLIALAGVPKLHSIYKRKQIQKEQAFSVGTITRFEYIKKRSGNLYRVYVQYSVDGKSFTGKTRALRTLTGWQLHSVLNEKLPVVYEKGNPANGVVLSTEEQFGHFEFAFPDSLRWTMQYFY